MRNHKRRRRAHCGGTVRSYGRQSVSGPTAQRRISTGGHHRLLPWAMPLLGRRMDERTQDVRRMKGIWMSKMWKGEWTFWRCCITDRLIVSLDSVQYVLWGCSEGCNPVDDWTRRSFDAGPPTQGCYRVPYELPVERSSELARPPGGE